MKILNEMKGLSDVSRRSFLKGTAALGASAVLYGCSKDGDGEPVYIWGTPDPVEPEATDYYYATGGHNCGIGGSRCVSKAYVKNGRIVRITSGSDDAQWDQKQDLQDSYGNTQVKICTRCRSYKYRIYHPGRLKYPLKQTKTRGDLSGFVRVSWDKALEEICKKHKAIIGKYGPESIYSMYACGSYSGGLQGGGYSGVWNGNSNNCVPLRFVGGYANYNSDYSYHQSSYSPTSIVGYSGSAPSIDQLAGGTCKNIVSFGNNALGSRQNIGHSTTLAHKYARDNGTNIIYIAPEFSDTGVNIADEWIPTKPYTTNALLAGMLYEALANTFKEDGTIYSAGSTDEFGGARPWLDVEFIDSAVYGFFDSPEYWIKTGSSGSPAQGTIVTDSASATSAFTKVSAVAPGMSYSAWIMGDDDRLKKARYDAVKNYVANKFAPVQTTRNADLCNQPVAQSTNTKYLRKKQYRVKKNAAWASQITGIPAERIKKLARMFTDQAQHPIFVTYAAGMEKQLDGIYTRIAVWAFLALTKTFGMVGDGAYGGRDGFTPKSGSSTSVDLPYPTPIRTGSVAQVSSNAPVLSVAQWHNAIRMAFMDVMLDPGKGSKVYTAKYIPDYKPTTDFPSVTYDFAGNKQYIGRVYHDDGGAKALVKLKRKSDGSLEDTDAEGFYQYETDAGGKPIYSGYRWIINSGGNILMNQHMNPNDTREMFESIPSCGQTNNPGDPDDLCVVSFDPFLSPSPRWSDYVLPAATQWEMDNRQSAGGLTLTSPVVSQPPGEAKSTYNFTVAFLAAYELIDPTKAGAALQYTGKDSASADAIPGDQYIDKFKRAYYSTATASTTEAYSPYNPSGKYYGKTFEEALKMQYVPVAPGEMAAVKASTALSGTRLTIETYLSALKAGSKTSADIFYPGISTWNSPSTGGNQYATGTSDTFPKTSGRYHVYSDAIVWIYEHRYEKWHKHLKDKGLPTGQRNSDNEGDPVMPQIPLYFNYEDSFMEAYGGPSAIAPEGNRFLVTTSHSRFRAHSSVAESPLVREITHRVKDGKPYSCNDWGTYALSEIDSNGNIPRLNSAIGKFGQTTDVKRASWHEAWINDKDAARLGISDGEIVQLENPVGAVRVAARVTKRAAKGYIALHQGAWYDPDPVDGVDDGGCANTLMCTKPSRLDHGNGQQSAMVTIKKLTF